LKIPSPSPASATLPSNAWYRAVWRWHFFAGLLVAPVAIFLAITGAIYLWQPQYEAWRYHDLLWVPIEATTVSAEAQLAAARAAAPPGSRAQSFQPAFASDGVAQVAFDRGLTIYVNPHSGAVVGKLRDADRWMNTVKELHGKLLAGLPGEYLVELAASWAIILFLTGLYLAWPRPRFTAWGFMLPRLRAKGRVFWRDLHVVPAVWCAAGTLFMLSTGLLWTKGAGQWYRTISTALGQGTPRASQASAHRSELVGWSPTLKSGLTEKVDQLASAPPGDEHAAHRGGRTAPAGTALPPDGPYEHALPLASVLALAAEHQVPQPFAIGLPVGPAGIYSAISDRSQPFRRAFLHLDQYSGRVLADVRFKDFGYLAQFFSWGIIAHEGRLFGLANQILGTLAAAGVLLLAASGLIMWWDRRPAGQLGAPEGHAALPRPVLIGTLVLACLLPLLAASLAVVGLIDQLLARKTKPVGSRFQG
jgi:uncharacterized iron-regulated membrane protein